MKASILLSTASLACLSLAHPSSPKNSTYYNPIIPGFHPDPSCVFVKEWDNTFFCAVSSFIAFPAMPVFASKDLAKLTAFDGFGPLAGQTFVARRQTDTLFQYSINVDFVPSRSGEEAGVTIFLSQDRHGDLGITNLDGRPQVRFRAEGPGAPATVVTTLPKGWKSGVTLQVEASNFTRYSLSAGPKGSRKLQTVACLDNAILSTSFTDKSLPDSSTFVGIYATTNGNGGEGTPAYFGNWKYQGKGQAIDDAVYYPSNGQ